MTERETKRAQHRAMVMMLLTRAQNPVARRGHCAPCSSWPPAMPGVVRVRGVVHGASLPCALMPAMCVVRVAMTGCGGRGRRGRPRSSSGRVTRRTMMSAASGSAGINQAYSTMLQLRCLRVGVRCCPAEPDCSATTSASD